MANIEPRGVNQVFGLDGTPLDPRNLPKSQTVRWVMRRKLEVLTAVRSGLLSVDDACKRYMISMDEFIAWRSAMDRFGPMGLRALHTDRSQSIGDRVSKIDMNDNADPLTYGPDRSRQK